MMQRLFFMMIFFLSLSLESCSKEDDNNPSNSENNGGNNNLGTELDYDTFCFYYDCSHNTSNICKTFINRISKPIPSAHIRHMK